MILSFYNFIQCFHGRSYINTMIPYRYRSPRQHYCFSRRNFKISILIVILIYSTFSSAVTFAEKLNVGMYGIWACEDKDQAFKLLADNGFNIASGVGGMDLLDKAHKYKIQCLVGAETQLTEDIANDPRRWKKYLEEINQQVKALKDHPAVFAWYFLDEPSWNKIPVNKVEEMNQIIRSIDEKHPIYTVLSTPESWQPYLPLFDIVAIDPYLRADKSKSDGQPEIVKDWIQKLKYDVNRLSENKPAVWAVLGAFDSKPKNARVKAAFRKPEPQEFDRMLELAMSENVDGLMIYSLAFKDSADYEDWYLPLDDPELWDVVKETPNKIEPSTIPPGCGMSGCDPIK